MNLRTISIIVLVLGLALIAIFQATRQTSSPVKLPSAIAHDAHLERVRVAGKVAADTIEYTVEPEMVLKFKIHDPGKAAQDSSAPTIAVIYQGIKPDMFAAGRDVIIDGEYKEGTLVATKLLTQCPSKYEPPKVGESGEKSKAY